MSLAFWFWAILIFSVIFGLYNNGDAVRTDIRGRKYGSLGWPFVLLILLVLLGWKTFGSPIRG